MKDRLRDSAKKDWMTERKARRGQKKTAKTFSTHRVDAEDFSTGESAQSEARKH